MPSDFQRLIDLKIKQHEAKEHQRTALQGHGRPIISVEHNGVRFVAVKNRLYYSGKWRTFVDFLFSYLRGTLGKEWLRNEAKKPAPERHPIITWFEVVRDFTSQQSTKATGDVYAAEPNGAFKALISLAYDLYLCAHNWELPLSLVKRLKNPNGFEGALYEAYVIGCFAKAGFELEFEEESKGGGTHCEFVATHRATGRKFSVEAKAIKGEASNRNKSKPKVHRKISQALRKQAAHDRIVFIELSQPDIRDNNGTPDWADHIVSEVEYAEAQDQGDLPPGFLFFTNRPFVHDPHLLPARETLAATGFKIPDFPYGRGGQFLREAVASRQRETEVYALLSAIETHTNIPSTFDASFFEEAELPSDHVRLLIGGTYYVPTEEGNIEPGVLTSATVFEEEKIVYGSYSLASGKSIIASTPICDAELRLFRRSPETFFGVVTPSTLQMRSAVDAYDFLWATYRDATRENLLKFLATAPDIEQLKTMTQEALAMEYCLRVAKLMWREKLMAERA